MIWVGLIEFKIIKSVAQFIYEQVLIKLDWIWFKKYNSL